jgi:hypothetical protein
LWFRRSNCTLYDLIKLVAGGILDAARFLLSDKFVKLAGLYRFGQ